MSPRSCIFPYLGETMMSLMVTFALAIKETFMIKSQNIVSMVQTSKVITR